MRNNVIHYRLRVVGERLDIIKAPIFFQGDDSPPPPQVSGPIILAETLTERMG